MEQDRALVEHLKALGRQLRAHGEARRFVDMWDWQSPPLDKNDLATIAEDLAAKVDAINWDSATTEVGQALEGLSQKVLVLTQRNAPNLSAGPTACEAIISGLYAIEMRIGALVTQKELKGTVALPAMLKRQVDVAKQRLDKSIDEISEIDQKLKHIERAYEAAEGLPITQQELETAITEVRAISKQVKEHDQFAEATSKKVVASQGELNAVMIKASDVLGKAENAYRAATSQGLAHAFSKKADELKQSMFLWVFGLLAALFIAGLISTERFPTILAAVTGKPDWGVVVANVILGAISLAAPVWFAWVSTKQIGQRFRLSEDYGYKAALAAAYEGYRTEAARLDKAFEAQLFATALGRLDELPLRLVEKNIAGSPMHEIFTSAEFKEAAEKVPKLVERIYSILKREAPKKTTKPEKTDEKTSEQPSAG